MKRLFTKILHMLFHALLRLINVCLTKCRREIKRLDSSLTYYQESEAIQQHDEERGD